MNLVPDEVRQVIDGVAAVGDLDQAFVLLTAGPTGVIDVCLLSRTELRATTSSILLVVVSSKARRNLDSSGQATLIVVCGNAANYLYLERLRAIAADGILALEFGVVRALHDDLGVELQPMMFRVEERLRIAERWSRTEALLGRLERAGARS